jgi:glycosyltransferase involved in cell wall biosynthesis
MKCNCNYILFQGNFYMLSSFSLINRILIKGLRESGFKVVLFPIDLDRNERLPKEIPDIYIFHGHPYDYKSSPGRFNIYIINYEYFQIKREDRLLITRLNHYFDLILVSTKFVRDILIENGLKKPIELLPWGVDRSEFHPGVKPKQIDGLREFNFIHVGVFTERKGIDILVDAYLKEFKANESVSLVIKEAMRLKHFEPWIEKVIKQSKVLNKNSPKIIHINQEERTVADYFTASDVGVFPFRGEGFGLPILECIASGRPVVVTNGTGPMDFCTNKNAYFINARKKLSRGKLQLEPDVKHLRRLMREAFNKGKLTDQQHREISESVSYLNWERTINKLRSVVNETLKHTNKDLKSNLSSRADTRFQKDNPIVCYAYYEKGLTSWKRTSANIHQILEKSFCNYFPTSFRDRPMFDKVDIVLGQSGFSLEQFIRVSMKNSGVLKILYRESGPIENMLEVTNRERQLCGLENRSVSSMELWRSNIEIKFADYLILPSCISKGLFMRAGFPSYKMKVLRLGINAGKPRFRNGKNVIRFLFVGTDPFRKGIRILFEAWDQLKLKKAELLCITNDIIHSKILLKYLVRNPNIKFKQMMPYKQFLDLFHNIDCQILPSLEDGFSFVIGEGMGFGIPAIVSEDTGISEIMTHMHDGYIIPTGSVKELKKSILYFYEKKKRAKEMGEAAYETASRYSWRRFRTEFDKLIRSLYYETG